MFRNLAIVTITCLAFACGLYAQEEDAVEERDSSAGLPKKFASQYLIASGTISPDQKMAVMYPKEDDDGKGKDFLIALKPFKILAALETKFPYFAHESHGGLSAEWSQDNSVALVTLDSKWGPGDVLLYEIREGKVARFTNLLGKIRALLEPDYQKVKAEPYNDIVDFVFDDGMVAGADSDQPTRQCKLEENQRVKIHAGVTTDPKHIGGLKAWDAKFEGVWDIPEAKFASEKVTRIFGGVRKDD